MKLRHALLLVLVLVACGRKDRPEANPPQTGPLNPSIGAWDWHPLGGLAVIEGEVSEPTELFLEGRSIREHRYAEIGPVRWELYRPPEGETAVLRTAEGRELARFEFTAQPTRLKPTQPPSIAKKPEPVAAISPGPAATPIAKKVEPPAAVRPNPMPPPVARKPEPPPALRPVPTPQPIAKKTEPPPAVRPNPAPTPIARKPEPPPGLRSVPTPQPIANKAEPPAVVRPNFTPPAIVWKPEPPSAIHSAPMPPPSTNSAPEPPAPTTRIETRLRNLPVTPLPRRKPIELPSISKLPTRLPRRASAFTPIPVETPPPQPVAPIPPPAALVTPIASLANPAKAWPGMGEALNLTRGPGGQKRILLSFDGGSGAEVATEVLDLLKARGVRTTLFLTGTFIQRYPTLVRRMASEGHELGNHTMNHPHFAPSMKRDPKWSRERIQRELLEADAALFRLLGRPMDPYWRAPYGEQTAEIRRWAEELGYRHVGWSEGADTLDWATPKERRLYRSGEAIVQRLEKRIGRDGDGLIVLMHLGSARGLGDRPTEGLGAFMDRARKDGWTFVSAGTILHDLGKPVWDPRQRVALVSGTPAPSR